MDTGLVQNTWRRLLRGPKYGIPRGTAVHGSRGFKHDLSQIGAALGSCERLRAWAKGHQVDLNDDPASLAALSRALDQRWEPLLENEIGLYLGTVTVRNLPQAQWHIWPNGHPVVQLPSGRTLDVVALVDEHARSGELLLADLYADAACDPPPRGQ
jgi:Family of unknown function (DUF6278)